MTKTEKAAATFAATFNCSQAVFSAFGTGAGMTEDQCLKLSCAFGGGMARNQMTCGAVTGALLALGLHFGRGAGDPLAATGNTYEKTNRFFEEFQKRHGSINCRELLHGLDMNNPADMEKIRDLDLFKTSCARYVKDAVEITEGLVNG